MGANRRDRRYRRDREKQRANLPECTEGGKQESEFVIIEFPFSPIRRSALVGANRPRAEVVELADTPS